MTPIHGQHHLTVKASADDVWQAMRNYGDLSWTEGIEEVVVEGEGVGMLRKVRLSGAGEWILERLTARDDASRTFSYAIEGDGMPGFSNYSAHVRAEPADEGCIIHWECRADAQDDAVEAMQPMVQALAEGISGLFAAQFNNNSDVDHE
jgi:carbon monoxide dehydrogenase subunit G